MITLKDFHKITNDLRLVGYFPKKSIVDRTIYKFTDKDITYNYLHLSSHMSYEIETKKAYILLGLALSFALLLLLRYLKLLVRLH